MIRTTPGRPPGDEVSPARRPRTHPYAQDNGGCTGVGDAPDPEVVLAAIRECVTVIGPGDVLLVRLPWGLHAETYREYGDYLADTAAGLGITNRILVLPAEHLGTITTSDPETGTP